MAVETHLFDAPRGTSLTYQNDTKGARFPEWYRSLGGGVHVAILRYPSDTEEPSQATCTPDGERSGPCPKHEATLYADQAAKHRRES